MALSYWPIADTQITEDMFEQVTAPGQVDGLIGHPSDSALVYADSSGRQVKWRASRYGRVRGFGFKTAATDEISAIGANASGSTRVDLAVVRLDRADWSVAYTIVAGTPGAGAPTPTQDNDPDSGVWEFPIAEVTVAPGAVTLAAGTVKNRGWYIGPGGKLLCLNTTRPPVSAGLVIHETDTGREYLAVGSSWRLTHDVAGPATPTAASGWEVGSNGASVYRRHGMVTLFGQFTRTGASIVSGGYKVATLPSGYRPPVLRYVIGYIRGASPAIVTLATNGDVTLISYPESDGPANGEYLTVPTVTYPVE